MSVIGNLDEEVLDDFKEIFTFTRSTTIIDNLGREQKTTLPPFDLKVYIHPQTPREFNNNPQEGYASNETLKIFGSLEEDLLQDDEFAYRGSNYRVLSDDNKVVGSYSKWIAGLIK